MTPRQLSDAQVREIARGVIADEVRKLKFLSESEIKVLVSTIFDERIQATYADIREIKSEMGTLLEKFNGLETLTSRIDGGFVEIKEWFKERAKKDDDWRDKVDDSLNKLGIVEYGKKVVDEYKDNTIKKAVTYAKYAQWAFGITIPGLIIFWRAFWRTVNTHATSGDWDVPAVIKSIAHFFGG